MLKKGETAFRLEKYNITLEAFQADIKYGGKNYDQHCDEAEKNSYCVTSKRSYRSLFAYKRVKVYIKFDDAEKGLIESKIYFDTAFHHKCSEPIFWRFKAYRRLGQTELAEAEEKRLGETPAVSVGGCDVY